MKTTLYIASERGNVDYGWLKANYSFSFANYYNPTAQNFGVLRVLNDDIIQGGMGFGAHPHENMEIVSIPLKGAMKHKDSMSNKWIPLKEGEVQVMSAGTGIQHSEMNNSTTEEVNLFQIWIFPKYQGVKPRYNQKSFNTTLRKNKLQVLVSDIENPIAESLTIHQKAKISRIDLGKDLTFEYQVTDHQNGVYIMNIEGEFSIDSKTLYKRDAIGIEQTSEILIKATQKSEILFIEVPMKL